MPEAPIEATCKSSDVVQSCLDQYLIKGNSSRSASGSAGGRVSCLTGAPLANPRLFDDGLSLMGASQGRTVARRREYASLR